MKVSRLLVRTLCGFRNLHQPTIKFHQHSSASRFVASPGMGVDTADLRSMGVLEPLVVGDDADGFFRAVHSPLMAYANYVHITGCKCNDFAAALLRDRAKITEQWQTMAARRWTCRRSVLGRWSTSCAGPRSRHDRFGITHHVGTRIPQQLASGLRAAQLRRYHDRRGGNGGVSAVGSPVHGTDTL